jgi:hypothetical protein
MYRILFIETGEYLYCLSNTPYANLYYSYEVNNLYKNICYKFKIYEVASKKEAIDKLSEVLEIELANKILLTIPDNRLLFEIVEV